MKTSVGIACGVFVAGLMSAPAWAQTAAAAPAPPPKNWTFTAGVDFPTAYVFRGIMQEKEGFIAQPFVDLGVSLGSGVSLNVGNWDSLHSGPTGTFYEADYYGALNFTAGKLKPGVLFTSYTEPERSVRDRARARRGPRHRRQRQLVPGESEDHPRLRAVGQPG